MWQLRTLSVLLSGVKSVFCVRQCLIACSGKSFEQVLLRLSPADPVEMQAEKKVVI